MISSNKVLYLVIVGLVSGSFTLIADYFFDVSYIIVAIVASIFGIIVGIGIDTFTRNAHDKTTRS